LNKRSNKPLGVQASAFPGTLSPASQKFFGSFFQKRTASFACVLLAISPALAGEHLDAAQVRHELAAGGRIDFSGKDLAGDDLAGLDFSGGNFRGAKLAGANLRGDKLVGADFSDADLRQADLSETWIMKARFDHANLHAATLQTIITSVGMDNQRETAASFVGADLSDTSATVHFSYDDMRGVNFTGTRQSVVLANQSMGMLRSEYVNADLDGANFSKAQLGRLTFRFAKLRGADFRGADLTRVDFTGANLSGADFTGAHFDATVFDDAVTLGATGLPRR
jgi:uncharacterized protein YjbI with pentapeptide repeats